MEVSKEVIVNFQKTVERLTGQNQHYLDQLTFYKAQNSDLEYNKESYFHLLRVKYISIINLNKYF